MGAKEDENWRGHYFQGIAESSGAELPSLSTEIHAKNVAWDSACLMNGDRGMSALIFPTRFIVKSNTRRHCLQKETTVLRLHMVVALHFMI